MEQRYELEAKTLEDLKQKAVEEHGADARLESAKRVTEGGVAGLFSKTHYEGVVVVGGVAPKVRRPQVDLSARAGIAALLAAVEAEDDRQTPLHLSTQTKSFDDLFDGMKSAYGDADAVSLPGEQETPPRSDSAPVHGYAPIPHPAFPGSITVPEAASYGPAEDVLTNPGDLVLVVGYGDDATTAVRAMAKAHKGATGTGGNATIRQSSKVEDRRSAINARADAVNKDKPLYVAYGMTAATAALVDLSELNPDQVWVCVNAGRKPADTSHLLRNVERTATVSGLTTTGSDCTLTPETGDLGYPIGWTDGERAGTAAG